MRETLAVAHRARARHEAAVEAARAARAGEAIVVVEDGGTRAEELIDELELGAGLVLRVRSQSRETTRRALSLAHDLGLPAVTTGALSVSAARRRVERACEARLPLPAGSFTAIGYRDLLDGREHLALTFGDISRPRPLVYVHHECLAGDTLRADSCSCGVRLRAAMDRIAAEGRGVVAYVRTDTHRIELLGTPHSDALSPDAVEIAREILADLGVGTPDEDDLTNTTSCM